VVAVFTGLIADVGTVVALDRAEDGSRLRIETELAGEIAAGDSVAVNGVCLTATAVGDGSFSAEAMNQTLSVTSLGSLEQGSRVNLELALRASDRLGGHIVQGHVDGTAEVVDVAADGFARRVRVRPEKELLDLAVEKGSVTLEGVSLTISDLTDEEIEVSLIPETLERTTLGELAAGDVLNVEADVVAKYVRRSVTPWTDRKEAG
jgi:riboflavin synthase